MSDQREREIIRAFVELSNELVGGYDSVELLAGLSESCTRLLDVAAAGVLLADRRGALRLVAASSERTRHLEVFQLQRDQGPCLDCYHTGTPVLVPDLSTEGSRWPEFVRAAEIVGFASVHAVPMRLHDRVLGTLGLFGGTEGSLEHDDVALGQALAHVASVALVNERAGADAAAVNAQLQTALDSRVVIEQAKGVIAHVGGLEIDQAFAVLRRYARDHGLKLTEVAQEVVERTRPGLELVEHARSAGILPDQG